MKAESAFCVPAVGVLSGHTLFKGQTHTLCSNARWRAGWEGLWGTESSCNPEQNPFVHNPRAGSRTQSVLGIEGCTLWVATALTKTSSMRLSPNARILSKTILGFCLGATRTHCALRRHWGSERWPSPSVSEVKQLLQDKRTHQDPATQV